MNISELANYAEIISGVAVIASLVYVAIQIRQNTAMVRTSNYADLSFKLSGFSSLVADNAELADIYIRGKADFDDLSEVEKTRFNLMLSRLLQPYQDMYHLNLRGYMDGQLMQTNLYSLSRFLAEPGLQQWWETNRFWWEEDFRHLVDGLIEQGKKRLEES